jgi:hypothetical protein
VSLPLEEQGQQLPQQDGIPTAPPGAQVTEGVGSQVWALEHASLTE